VSCWKHFLLGWGEARWEREIWCCCIVLGVESNGHVVSLAMVLYSGTGWFKGEEREVRSNAGRASKRHGSDRGIPPLA
jgi:hypothetical protein